MVEKFTFTKIVYEEESEDISESNDTIEQNIPTIQNMTVTQTETLPTKNTLTGDFRQQFVVRKPPSISFSIILQDDTFLGEDFTIDQFIELFEKLRTERIRFDIVTNRSKINEQYLTDLAVRKLTYKRDNQTRQIVTLDIECVQVRFAAITWELVNLVELFGTIFETEDVDPNVRERDFTLRSDTEEKFKSKGLFKFFNPDSVNEMIGNAIKNKIGELPGFHWELPTPIDFRQSYEDWRLTARFGSVLDTVETNEAAYPVKLLSMGFKTLRMPETEWTEGMVVSKVSQPPRYVRQAVDFVYDFTNTYRHAVPESSFEERIMMTDIWNWLSDNPEYIKVWDKNEKASYSGTKRDIRVNDNNRVWIKPLRKQYHWEGSWSNDERLVEWSGTPSNISFEWKILTTTDHDYAPDFGKYQDTWDNLTGSEYTIYILIVSVGSLAQIFLFAPNLTSDATLIRATPTVTV